MMLEMTNIMLEMDDRGERATTLAKRYALLALGIAVCLMGAFLMAWWEPALGNNHTGIARVIGIVGIGIIACSRKRMENRN